MMQKSENRKENEKETESKEAKNGTVLRQLYVRQLKKYSGLAENAQEGGGGSFGGRDSNGKTLN